MASDTLAFPELSPVMSERVDDLLEQAADAFMAGDPHEAMALLKQAHTEYNKAILQ